jgi:hypothetical protein
MAQSAGKWHRALRQTTDTHSLTQAPLEKAILLGAILAGVLLAVCKMTLRSLFRKLPFAAAGGVWAWKCTWRGPRPVFFTWLARLLVAWSNGATPLHGLLCHITWSLCFPNSGDRFILTALCVRGPTQGLLCLDVLGMLKFLAPRQLVRFRQRVESCGTDRNTGSSGSMSTSRRFFSDLRFWPRHYNHAGRYIS